MLLKKKKKKKVNSGMLLDVICGQSHLNTSENDSRVMSISVPLHTEYITFHRCKHNTSVCWRLNFHTMLWSVQQAAGPRRQLWWKGLHVVSPYRKLSLKQPTTAPTSLFNPGQKGRMILGAVGQELTIRSEYFWNQFSHKRLDSCNRPTSGSCLTVTCSTFKGGSEDKWW